MKILFLVFYAMCLVFQSCENKTHIKNELPVDLSTMDTLKPDGYIDKRDEPDVNVAFPETGKNKTDFVPHPYQIQYEAIGDINNDGISDIILVLHYPLNGTLPRPMLVLLRQEDNSLFLDKISKEVFPTEYNDYDYKLYDTEDISIENGELYINLYSIGPSGNIFASFKYFENDLILTSIEGFYRGAGGSSGIVYDFSKGEITTTDTNTMEEDMPTSSETIKMEKERYLFENTSITTFFNEDE